MEISVSLPSPFTWNILPLPIFFPSFLWHKIVLIFLRPVLTLTDISSSLACTALFVHCCNTSNIGLPPSVCPYSLLSSLKVNLKSTNNLFNFMFYMTSIHTPIKICSFYFTPLKNYFSHSNYLPSQSWSVKWPETGHSYWMCENQNTLYSRLLLRVQTLVT